MRVRKTGERYLIRLEPDEEALTALRTWAQNEDIGCAALWAIGAMCRAVVGHFDPAVRTYHQIRVEEQVEVLSLTGNVARSRDGSPVVHVHVVLSRPDGSTVGGHLMEGVVFPMLEVVALTFPEALFRDPDPTMGLTVWSL
ncbi:MAG: DUF296 domain-containing protein [Thermoflexia bacterium]|nr:MAG: DUF296 domain-containing protein [Thermoflexia bacterium]